MSSCMTTRMASSGKTIDDIPTNASEPDWIDDFIAVIDAMPFEEILSLKSMDVILLKLGINGYQWSLDYEHLWIGLIAFLKWNCSPERLQLERLVKIVRNSSYGCTVDISAQLDEVLRSQGAGRAKWRVISKLLLQDFMTLSEDSRDKVFAYASRLAGSSFEFDYELSHFRLALSIASIPKDDVPEA